MVDFCLKLNYFKNDKLITFPLELLFEIINCLPFNLNWTNKRVSIIFDLFLLKTQNKWIVHITKMSKLVHHVSVFYCLLINQFSSLTLST